MKVKIAGKSLVIESATKAEDIKLLQKYNSDALVLKDEEGKKALFAMSVGTSGGITEYGITFDGVSFGEKKVANLTLEIPNDVTDAAEYAADILGKAHKYLPLLEKQVAECVEAVKNERKKLVESISIDD